MTLLDKLITRYGMYDKRVILLAKIYDLFN